MADSFFNRQFLFVVVFMGTFALIISQMPIQLADPLTKRQVRPTEDWLVADLVNYYEIWGENLNTSVYKYHDTLSHTYTRDIDIGEHDIDIVWSEPNYTNPIGIDHEIRLIHWYAIFFLFPATHHKMEFNNVDGTPRGVFLEMTEVDQDFDSDINASRYSVECNHFSIEVYVGYNLTLYSDATDAFDHDGINVFSGIGFEDVGTSFNAWSLLNPILFFQTPSTFNVMNAVVAIPIWLSIIYISITVILWFIPFLSKG